MSRILVTAVINELKVDPTLSSLLHESILSAAHNLQEKCCSAALQIVTCPKFKRSQTLLSVSFLRARTDSLLFLHAIDKGENPI